MSTDKRDIHGLVTNLFRQQAGQLTATILRLLGPSQLATAEDIVQETIMRALGNWSYHGIPDNPAGWLVTTAKRIALDRLRHQAMQHRYQDELIDHMSTILDNNASTPDPKFNGELRDDLLSLMFACCRADDSQTTQIALILHLVSGFSAREIARAFMQNEQTMSQRLVRAKRAIRENPLSLASPTEKEITQSRDSVLAALYAMFNEGYKAGEGEALFKEELCDEAIRLATLFTLHSSGDCAESHALLALFYFQRSRLRTRTDSEGNLVVLEEQNRSLWSRTDIDQGVSHLGKATTGPIVSRYHLEAGIASLHSLAATYEQTNWAEILELYNDLIAQEPTAVVQLNRCVALAMVHGAKAGITELDRLREVSKIDNHYLFHATYGELCARDGMSNEARESFEKAIGLCDNEVERAFLRHKLDKISGAKGSRPTRS